MREIEDIGHRLKTFIRCANGIEAAEKLFKEGAEKVTLFDSHRDVLIDADPEVLRGIEGGAEKMYHQMKPFKKTLDGIIFVSKNQ